MFAEPKPYFFTKLYFEMNTTKVLLATLAGGVVNFLLGGLIYGKLLTGFFASNAGSATGAMRGDSDMILWSLILGNFFSAFLLTYIFARWAGISTAPSGMMAGATIGLLMAAAYDFTMYGVSNLSNLNGTIVDILVSGVIGAISGAVIGWVLGYGEPRRA